MKSLESIHSTALKKRVCVCVRAGVYVCEVVDTLGTWKHKVRKVQGRFWSLLELRGQPGLPVTVSTEKNKTKNQIIKTRIPQIM